MIPSKQNMTWTAVAAIALLTGSALAQSRPADTAPAATFDPDLMLNKAAALYTLVQTMPTTTVELSSDDVNYLTSCIAILAKVIEMPQGSISDKKAAARFIRAMAHARLALHAAARPAEAGDHYRQMREDLGVLLQNEASHCPGIVHLLDAVASMMLAGADASAKDAPAGARARFLDDAQRALEKYLATPTEDGKPPGSLDRARALYFRGVTLYRLGAATGEVKWLSEARQILAGLVAADPSSQSSLDGLFPATTSDEAKRGWKVFAWLYLGLTDVRLANASATSSNQFVRQLKEAQSSLGEAGQIIHAPGLEPKGWEGIEQLINTQVEQNRKAIEEAKTGQGNGMDFRLDWVSGLAYDTNVPLLGGNTATPSDLGRKRDWRFQQGTALTFNLDLGKASPELDGWTLGVAGRAFGSWHADIFAYNEQDYGASVALRRQVLPKGTEGGKHGPLYATVQYDYDYYMLGNNGFLRMNRVAPRLTLYTFDERAETDFGFRYEDRNYLDPLYDLRFDRDGNYFAFGLTQSIRVVDMTELYKKMNWDPYGRAFAPREYEDTPKAPPVSDTAERKDTQYARWLKPYIGAEYGWDSTLGQEYDTDRTALVAGLDMPLPWGVVLDFRGEWSWENYKGAQGGSLIDFHRRGRDDFIQRYGVGIERGFVLAPGEPRNRGTAKVDRVVMTVRLGADWIQDDSNVLDRLGQAVFSYDRAIYGLTVTLSFN